MEKYQIINYPDTRDVMEYNCLLAYNLLTHIGYEQVSFFITDKTKFLAWLKMVGLDEEPLNVVFKNYKDGLHILIGKSSINLNKKEYSVAELNAIKKKVDKEINEVKNDILKDLGNYIKEELKKHIPVDYTYTITSHPNSLAIGVKIKHWEDATYQWEINKTFKTLVKLDLGYPKSSLDALVNPSLLQDLVAVQNILMSSAIYFKNKTYLTDGDSNQINSK